MCDDHSKIGDPAVGSTRLVRHSRSFHWRPKRYEGPQHFTWCFLWWQWDQPLLPNDQAEPRGPDRDSRNTPGQKESNT